MGTNKGAEKPKVDMKGLEASKKAHEKAISTNQIVVKNEQANHTTGTKR